MKRSKITNFALICFAAACMPTVAHATLIDGSQLHISGDAQLSTTSVTWQCNQAGDAGCPVANHGDFAVSSSTGSFAQYNGTFGLLANINYALQPLNALFSLPNFITFDLNNDISVELTFIPLGNDTASTTCAGLTHCTPQNPLLITPSNPAGLSDYNLDSNVIGTVLTFGVIGIVHQAGGATGNVSGIFSAGFNGLNTQQTLTAITVGSTRTYSGDLSLTVTQASTPEPASMLLSGLGLVGLGLVSRRVRRS